MTTTTPYDDLIQKVQNEIARLKAELAQIDSELAKRNKRLGLMKEHRNQLLEQMRLETPSGEISATATPSAPVPAKATKTSTKKTRKQKSRKSKRAKGTTSTGKRFQGHSVGMGFLKVFTFAQVPTTLQEAMNAAFPTESGKEEWSKRIVMGGRKKGTKGITWRQDLHKSSSMLKKLIADSFSKLRELQANNGEAPSGQSIAPAMAALYKNLIDRLDQVETTLNSWGITTKATE